VRERFSSGEGGGIQRFSTLPFNRPRDTWIDAIPKNNNAGAPLGSFESPLARTRRAASLATLPSSKRLSGRTVRGNPKWWPARAATATNRRTRSRRFARSINVRRGAITIRVVSRRPVSSRMRIVEALSIPGAAIFRRVRLLRASDSLDKTAYEFCVTPQCVCRSLRGAHDFAPRILAKAVRVRRFSASAYLSLTGLPARTARFNSRAFVAAHSFREILALHAAT
jgi:hypothetical protein